MNAAILSSASALLGALAGGGASLAAAVYTQRYQDRLQRNAREMAKRESAYADFITTASAIRVVALVEDGIAGKRSSAAHRDTEPIGTLCALSRDH